MESVSSQLNGNAEHIVVDPGSTDGSRDIIHRWQESIRTILEPDAGPADGLNKGFAGARGGVFGYINADDRLAPGALSFVRDFFTRHPDADVLCGAIRIIDREGHASVRKRTADRFDLTRYAAGICTVGQQATFFRRSAFERAGGFNPENRITWDGELLVDMALTGARFRRSSRVLGDFRIYPESITGSNLHRERVYGEHDRIAEKIRKRGIRVYSGQEKFLQRLLYKANVFRHLGYLLSR